jgi:hypothetical protein
VEGFGIAAGGVSAVHPPFDWMRTVSGQETTHRSSLAPGVNLPGNMQAKCHGQLHFTRRLFVTIRCYCSPVYELFIAVGSGIHDL